MSWNKNTVVTSALDATVDVLKNLGAPFDLSVRGIVAGHGLNDDIDWGESKTYNLHRLEYGEHVVLEQMERTCDCDSDDALSDKMFTLSEEPKNYPLEVFTCVCGYDCYNINQEENKRNV